MTWSQRRMNRRKFLEGALALSGGAVLSRKAFAGEFVANTHNVICLPCGRRLGFAEYGDSAGANVAIYHHGIPSCRLDGAIFLDTLRARPSTRLLVIDRPGFGLSDPDPKGDFFTWINDLLAVVAARKIESFVAMASSGGTPYALATARALPDRVPRVVLACPMAPLEAVGIVGAGARGVRFAQRHPVASRAALGKVANAWRRHPDRIPLLLLPSLSYPDRQLLADLDERRYAASVFTGAFCQGPAWVAHGAAQIGQPWSCWLRDVRQKVTIFHGCHDEIAPPAMAKYLASALPNSELHLYENEGHLSLPRRLASTIIDAAFAPAVGASARR